LAIPQTNLDDRTFDQLATEALSLIPRYCPAWTDYNPSDPGITLLELFAYLTEASIYHINRIPERSLERYAALVGVTRSAGEPITETLNRAVASLDSDRHPQRAITESDIERLMTSPALNIARCQAVVEPFPNPASDGGAGKPAYFPGDSIVKIIIVPTDPAADVGALCERAFEFLKPRSLVATKINVTAPDYTTVKLSISVVRSSDSSLGPAALGPEVATAVSKFLDDRIGGIDGKGWPFGRAVYRSDLYRLIEGLEGVDHVTQLLMHDDASPEDDASRAAIPLISRLSLVRLFGPTVSVI
jgi:hypothetical protein